MKSMSNSHRKQIGPLRRATLSHSCRMPSASFHLWNGCEVSSTWRETMLQVLVDGVQLYLHCLPSQLVHAPGLAGQNADIQHDLMMPNIITQKMILRVTPAECLKIYRLEIPNLC